MTLLAPLQQDSKKRIDSKYYVEGYATKFEPYVLYEDEEGVIYERFEPGAFSKCDMSDVIFQYNHEGRVFARQSNKSLIVEPDNVGLFCCADLGLTTLSKQLYEDIAAELTTKMSWGFRLGDWQYDPKTRTIIHYTVKKIYDVSAVSLPANNDTEINARSFADGEIMRVLEESQKQQRNYEIEKLKLLMEVKKCTH